MKNLRGWIALTAVAVFVAGAAAIEAQGTGWLSLLIAESSGAVQARGLNVYGAPIFVGRGTAVPTVANSGAPPMDGELFIVTADSTSPDLQWYDDTNSTWNSVAGLDIAETFTAGVTFSATTTFTGASTFNGDVTMGSDEEDAVTVNAPMAQLVFRDNFCGVGVAQNDGTTESGVNTEVNLIKTTANKDGYYQYIDATAGSSMALPLTTGVCGIQLGGDTTANDGQEIRFVHDVTDSVHTIQAADTSATFYFEISLTIADISAIDGTGWGVGLAQPAAQIAAIVHDTLDTYVILTFVDNSGDLALEADVNGGGEAQDDITEAWTDGQTKVLRFEINTDGYAVYIDGTAQTVTTINSGGSNDFTDLDKVVPFIMETNGAEGADIGTIINYVEWGYGAL